MYVALKDILRWKVVQDKLKVTFVGYEPTHENVMESIKNDHTVCDMEV